MPDIIDLPDDFYDEYSLRVRENALLAEKRKSSQLSIAQRAARTANFVTEEVCGQWPKGGAERTAVRDIAYLAALIAYKNCEKGA